MKMFGENFRKIQNFREIFHFLCTVWEKTRIIIYIGYNWVGDRAPEARNFSIILSKPSTIKLQNLRNFQKFSENLSQIIQKLENNHKFL